MRLGLNVVLGHGVPCPNDGLAGGVVKAGKKTEKPLAGSSVPAGKKKRPRRGTAPPCPYGRSTHPGKKGAKAWRTRQPVMRRKSRRNESEGGRFSPAGAGNS